MEEATDKNRLFECKAKRSWNAILVIKRRGFMARPAQCPGATGPQSLATVVTNTLNHNDFVTFTSLQLGTRATEGQHEPISRPKWRVTVSDNPAKSKFPELMQLRLPRGTNAALDELASKLHRSKSEIVRQAILREIAPVGLVQFRG